MAQRRVAVQQARKPPPALLQAQADALLAAPPQRNHVELCRLVETLEGCIIHVASVTNPCATARGAAAIAIDSATVAHATSVSRECRARLPRRRFPADRTALLVDKVALTSLVEGLTPTRRELERERRREAARAHVIDGDRTRRLGCATLIRAHVAPFICTL